MTHAEQLTFRHTIKSDFKRVGNDIELIAGREKESGESVAKKKSEQFLIKSKNAHKQQFFSWIKWIILYYIFTWNKAWYQIIINIIVNIINKNK